MGFMSTIRRVELHKGVALVAILGGLALGCSDSIDGAPSCSDKQLVVTGQSSGRDISIDQSVSGGATQTSSGGTMTLNLDAQAAFTLTWDSVLDSGDVTTVNGSVNGIPGGPFCYGGDSQVEIGDTVTFHLAGLHDCNASSIVLGEVFGCAGVTTSTSGSASSN
jgi:hypothetical protein